MSLVPVRVNITRRRSRGTRVYTCDVLEHMVVVVVCIGLNSLGLVRAGSEIIFNIQEIQNMLCFNCQGV